MLISSQKIKPRFLFHKRGFTHQSIAPSCRIKDFINIYFWNSIHIFDYHDLQKKSIMKRKAGKIKNPKTSMQKCGKKFASM